MRRTYAALVACALVAAFAASNAWAMYHPGLGVFMQRDPGGGAAPARIGTAGPAAPQGRFIPRDTEGQRLDGATLYNGGRIQKTTQIPREVANTQYHDGMSLYQYVGSDPVNMVDPTGTIRWATARQTGEFSYPWARGPGGCVYDVKTDAGNTIKAWRPSDGRTYWCHGYTFGGSSAAGGPFSIWGESVDTVIRDDGWKHIPCASARPSDIAVFRQGGNVGHSGIVNRAGRVYLGAGYEAFDERLGMLNSKWGPGAQNIQSFNTNAAQYGKYRCYSKIDLGGDAWDRIDPGENEQSRW